MSTLEKRILIYLALVLGIGALAFIIYRQEQINTRQLAIESQVVAQKQLVDGIVRSQASWATKDDVSAFAKANDINLKAIQDDLDKLHADVAAVNVAVATSQGQSGTHLPSTSTGPGNPTPPGPVTVPCPSGGTVDCPNPDPFGYMKTQQNLALNENFGTLRVPIGNVGFSAWQDKPWDININAREYHATTTIGTDENQRLYTYNKLEIKSGDKTYTVPLTSSKTEQVYPEAKWSWWNPRLFLGVDGAVGLNPVRGEFTPGVSLQVMSYGRYKTQPDFSILQVGAGYGTVSQRPQFMISPFQYNVGKNIPLMNNTYIGPVISVGTDGNVGVGGGIRVGL